MSNVFFFCAIFIKRCYQCYFGFMIYKGGCTSFSLCSGSLSASWPLLSVLLGVNIWPGGLFPFDSGPGKGPSGGCSHWTARTRFPAGRRTIGPTGSLLSLKTVQQINCSCALEFPQHTNLHDVKQLGGNPSMPWTEAELPMSYGD